MTLSDYTDAELRAELQRRADDRRMSRTARALTPAFRLVEQAIGAPFGSITSRRRVPAAVRARWAVMAALVDLGWSYPSVGRLLGYDHTTVCHAARRADWRDVSVARPILAEVA